MEGIRIRMAVEEVAEDMLRIYAPYVEQTAITFEYETPSVAQFRERIAKRLAAGYPWLAALRQGQIVGYAYAGPFVGREAYSWSAELSIYVERSLRRSGVGGRLYRELEARLRQMGILNLYACIAWPRVEDEYLTRDSAHFPSHLGFKLAGTFAQCGYKFGRWYDMIWMEKIIGEHVSPAIPVKRCPPDAP